MKNGEWWLKLIFGVGILLILGELIHAVAVGQVEEKSSYGLMPLVLVFYEFSKSYSRWAFRINGDELITKETKESKLGE